MKSFSRVTLSFATFSAIRQPSVGKFLAKRQRKSYRGGCCCQANSPAQTDNNGIASDGLRGKSPTIGVHPARRATQLFRVWTMDLQKLSASRRDCQRQQRGAATWDAVRPSGRERREQLTERAIRALYPAALIRGEAVHGVVDGGEDRGAQRPELGGPVAGVAQI